MRKIFVTLALTMLPGFVYGLPAFPGAEGQGADTIGGRGGSVCIVDTLSDDTADGNTFRDCVETATGPRYVTFRVSGVIDLTSQINITNPYLTVAGETSPGGIAITGWQTTIKTHDVIMRHMRFRLGAHRANDAVNAEVNDALNVWGNESGTAVTAYNIIIDHCSMAYGLDETATINYNAQDVTFSWCMITNGLRNSNHPDGLNHSAGFMAWGGQADPFITASLHHSFIGFNYFRNPASNGDSFLDSVNNVAYYWDTTNTHLLGNNDIYSPGSTANLIGNYYKTDGAESTSYSRAVHVLQYDTNIHEAIYMNGNLDGSRTSQSDAQWTAQKYFLNQLLDIGFQRLTPWSTVGYSGTAIPVAATDMGPDYASYVVENAGATVPVRDGVDIAAAAHYEDGTGSFTNASEVDTLSEIEALVALSSPSAPVDSDNDGMADTWEISEFGDLSQTATGDFNGDGYNNIEGYFHWLVEGSNPASPSIKSGMVRIGGALVRFQE